MTHGGVPSLLFNRFDRFGEGFPSLASIAVPSLPELDRSLDNHIYNASPHISNNGGTLRPDPRAVRNSSRQN